MHISFLSCPECEFLPASFWNPDLPPPCSSSLGSHKDKERGREDPTNSIWRDLIAFCGKIKWRLAVRRKLQQSCETMCGVNAVTVQRSQRCCRITQEKDKVCAHAAPENFCPPPPPSSLLSCVPLWRTPVCKFNQTPWIKAITQFVYKASFIRCQDGARWPPTFAEVTRCIYYAAFRAVIRRQGAKDAWWESYYSNVSNIGRMQNHVTLSAARADHANGAWTTTVGGNESCSGSWKLSLHLTVIRMASHRAPLMLLSQVTFAAPSTPLWGT